MGIKELAPPLGSPPALLTNVKLAATVQNKRIYNIHPGSPTSQWSTGLNQTSTRCQFHQYLMSSFFIQKFFAQLWCAYNLGLQFFGEGILAQKLLIKCWWNWHQVDLGDGEIVKFAAVSVGNPHAVVRVDQVDEIPLDRFGGFLNSSKGLFPEGVNVEVVQIITDGHVRVRVYERGVGETEACGSGACATVITLRRKGLVQGPML